MTDQYEITLTRMTRGYHLITEKIIPLLRNLPEKGLVNLFLKHTSAALTINENADPSVRYDFESFMNKLVPEEDDFFSHNMEGSDDMPAHLKSSILGQSITIPISHHKFNLGTWQGIYLCEFRNHAPARTILITIIGE
jgi:secondary thiamine-phosphate synthase enzyme